MANPDSVGQFYLDSFGYGRVGVIQATPLNTSGNAVFVIPLLSGGLTNSGATISSGSLIPRRITVSNPSGSVSSANVSITTSNDGNISNAVVGNTVLTAVSAVGKYQDLTISYTANTAITGNVTSALYVNVNTASGNANTVTISVYGDVVSF
jgi:hypothetical protein